MPVLALTVGFFVMISLNVLANLLMKMGATSGDHSQMIFGLVHWKTAAGIVAFGSAAIVYTWLLRVVPLHVAQVFLTMQFVGSTLASAAVLGEQIPPLRWTGILIIAFGILIVGLTFKR
ncbi:MAG: hypothetical protein WCJ64_00185 [Rhodospirillaceae bacterium]